MLAVLNEHERDQNIFFDSDAHRYTTERIKDFTSVTTFIKKFFNEFDADKVIAKMAQFGALEKKYPGMTAEEVKAAWKTKGQTAAQSGTKMHHYIELFFNGLPSEEDDHIGVEADMFKDWLCDLDPKYIPFRTEWVIYDEDLKIAGTIDMLFRTSEVDPKRVAIFDWKKVGALKYKNRYERAKDPIGHLDDCNYNHYCLQLNLYKYLLEKNYGLQVEEMCLVVIHRDNNEVQLVPLPVMTTDIIAMLDNEK